MHRQQLFVARNTTVQAEDSPIPYLFRSLTWVQFSSVMSSNRHLSIGWGDVVRVYTHMYLHGMDTVSMSMDDTFRTINKIRWIGGSITTNTNTGRRKRKINNGRREKRLDMKTSLYDVRFGRRIWISRMPKTDGQTFEVLNSNFTIVHLYAWNNFVYVISSTTTTTTCPSRLASCHKILEP